MNTSRLSELFGAGDAGDATFQPNILRHLNEHDWLNLRQTNKHMNWILNTKRARKHLRGQCQSRSYFWARPTLAASRPCITTAHDDVPLRFCTGLRELEPWHVIGDRPAGAIKVSHMASPLIYRTGGHWSARLRVVCAPCHDAIQRLCDAKETRFISNLHAQVCPSCEYYERACHPQGINSCVCKETIQGGWKCWDCRNEVLNQVNGRAQVHAVQLRWTRRDRHGLVFLNINRPPRIPPGPPVEGQQVCRCGRLFKNRDAGLDVKYCKSCKGVIVVPQDLIRSSARIQQNLRSQPSPILTPIMLRPDPNSKWGLDYLNEIMPWA